MQHYRLSFTARRSGAIGVPQQFTVTVRAEDAEEARLKLYDNFDHVHNVVITHQGEPTWLPETSKH